MSADQGSFSHWRRVRWFFPVHRRSRMWLLVLLCQILVATALMTTLLINQRMQDGFHLKAAEFIAGDLRISHHKLDVGELRELATESGLRFSYARTMLTSVLKENEELQLSNLKGIDAAYPLRGELVLERIDGLAAHPQPSPGKIWVDSSLRSRGVDLGGQLRVGDQWFAVEAFVTSEPDKPFAGPGAAPRVMMSHSDLMGSNLIQRNTRSNLLVMLAGKPEALAAFMAKADLPDNASVIRASGGGRRDVREVVKNLSLFVNLAGFVAMLFSAIVLYLALQLLETEERRMQRLLWHWGNGFFRRSLWFWTRVLAIALLANLIGGLLSMAIQDYTTERYLTRFFPDLPAARASGVWQASALSLAVLPVAALSLWQCLRRPWLGSIDRAYTMHIISWLLLATLTGGFFAARINNAGLLGGLIFGVALSLLLYQLFVRFLLIRIPARGAFWSLLKTNLGSRSRLSMLQVCSLSLVMMIAMSVFLLREGMLVSVEKSLAPDTPNNYLISIQPDEREAIETQLASAFDFAEPLEFYPIIRARVTRVNGEPIVVDSAVGMDRQMLLREWGLSYTARSHNPIIDGEWFRPAPVPAAGSPAPAPGADEPAGAAYAPEWSISTDVVRALDLKIGDTLTFSAAGVGDFTGKVSSIRRVDWTTIKPNFFVLASPGLLDEAPTTFLTAVRIDKERTPDIARIASAYPGVTHLDLNLIIDRFQELIGVFLELMWIVLLYVGALVLIALACILQFSVETSGRETALMKSFGVPLALMRRVRQTENLILSTLAVLPAALIAGVSSYYFYTDTLQLPFFDDLFENLFVLSIVSVATIALLTAVVERLLIVRRSMLTLRGASDYHG